mgnify:CR=1 FL=1
MTRTDRAIYRRDIEILNTPTGNYSLKFANGGGELPKQLQGEYTSVKEAAYAVDRFMLMKEAEKASKRTYQFSLEERNKRTRTRNRKLKEKGIV